MALIKTKQVRILTVVRGRTTSSLRFEFSPIDETICFFLEKNQSFI